MGQKEQNANSVNILFGLSTQKHITSADLQITQVERLRTLKQLHQAANFLKANNMADVIKDFEEWYAKLPAPYKEDFMNTPALGEWAAKGFNAGHRACQQLNNTRIADLEATIRNMAAVIAKKNEALIIACSLIEKFSLHVVNGSDCMRIYDAANLTADGVELVEVGYIGTESMEVFLTMGMPISPESCDEPVEKLYTIKQKE